jgi:hypothetical protein
VRHGIRVGLRGPAPDEPGSGTTAEIYLPPTVLEGAMVGSAAVSSPSAKLASALAAPEDVAAGEAAGQHPAVAEAVVDASTHNGSDGSQPPITLLPRRSPGSSGITEVPAHHAEQQPRSRHRELATPWWESENQREPKQAPPAPAPGPAVSDTTAFFAARSRGTGDRTDTQPAKPAHPAAHAATPSAPRGPTVPKGPAAPVDDDVIYRRMLSEMLGDPHDLVKSPDLDWQSVWDRGWSLAAEAEDKPVEARTADHGLPVRTPGARLVPGAANGVGHTGRADEPDEPGEADEPDHSGRQPQHAAALRDPEAVRSSFSSHFGGVRSARSHARETSEGPDQQ